MDSHLHRIAVHVSAATINYRFYLLLFFFPFLLSVFRFLSPRLLRTQCGESRLADVQFARRRYEYK